MKKFFKILFALILLQSFSLFAAEEKIILKIGSVAPARSPWDVELKKMAAEWNRITNGAVNVRFQNMTTLGGEKAGIQKMQPRRPGQQAPLDGGVFSSIGLNEIALNAKIFTLSTPFLIRSQNELDAVIKNFGREIEAEYEKVGMKLLAWTNAGWIRFYTKNSYSDVAGLRRQTIACSGFDSPALSNAFKVAGFSVKDIPANKLSQMLKTGGVEGFLSVPMLTYFTGDYKSINYGLDTRLCPVMAGLVISQDSWQRIPQKYHSQLLASMQRTVKKLNSELENFDVNYTRRMTNNGLKLIMLNNQQIATWDKDLGEAMRRATSKYPEIFNVNLYNKIKNLLEKMRK